MELSRLRRMVRARWWLIAAMAAIGVVAAIAFTNYSNDNIEQRFSAVASITFIVEEPEEEAATTGGGNSRNQGGGTTTNTAAAEVLDTALAAAEEINATLLEEPGVALRGVPEEARLEFLAISPSEQTAEEIVIEMRDNYLAVDPTTVDVPGEIAILVEEASTITVRLKAFEAPPPPEEVPIPVDIQAQIDILNNRITATTGDVGEIEEELFAALEVAEEDRDTDLISELEGRLDRITARLTDLKGQLEAITPVQPPVEEFELTAEEELEKTALEARMTEISQQFLALQEQLESTDRLVVGEVVLTDETSAPTDRMLSALIGLLAGAMAGLAAIVIIDRIQGTVWSRSDLGPVPILAEVPQQQSRFGMRPRRYQQVRQKGVQSARSAILGLYHAGGPVTIGFTGLGTTDDSVSGLVLDVANSLAGVGRSVLVVDGQIGGLPAYRDIVAGGSNLADLDYDAVDDDALAAGVTGVLDGAHELAPNLWILPGDARTVDAVDVLASKSFRQLTEQAVARYDIVMVVGPSALSPFAYVMAGLVSAYVVITTMGRTRQQHIERLVEQFGGSRSRLIGAILLGIKPRRGFVPASDISRTALEPGAAGAASAAETEPEEERGLLDRLGESLGALAGDKTDT